MGKRSTFPRRKQDAYDTPLEAVRPLVPHLPYDRQGVSYWEPCAGSGQLIAALDGLWPCGVCVLATDIEPRDHTLSADIERANALGVHKWRLEGERVEYIITNPPWTRPVLHEMVERFSNLRPTWLLFDADWMHTKQAIPYLPRLRKIVSVGRVSWMQNGTSGMDNCAWYLFDQPSYAPAQFFGRAA